MLRIFHPRKLYICLLYGFLISWILIGQRTLRIFRIRTCVSNVIFLRGNFKYFYMEKKRLLFELFYRIIKFIHSDKQNNSAKIRQTNDPVQESRNLFNGYVLSIICFGYDTIYRISCPGKGHYLPDKLSGVKVNIYRISCPGKGRNLPEKLSW